MNGHPDPVPASLAALADAHGVATAYRDADDRWRVPPATTVRAVLAALGVQAHDDEAVSASLVAADAAGWRRTLPASVVMRADRPATVPTVLAADTPARAGMHFPDGRVEAVPLGPKTAARHLDGRALERRELTLPAGSPSGDARLRVEAAGLRAEASLLVAPARCPAPPDPRGWGWQVQLYALASAASAGVGDLADLAHLAHRAGTEHGADLILTNPLHAAMPALPYEASPYYPASRRFADPLVLRVEHCDGWGDLGPDDRADLTAALATCRAPDAASRPAVIDRDAVFRAKTAAFGVLARVPLPPSRQAAFDAYRASQGEALTDFATACALAERHGRSFADWPAALHDPRGPAALRARDELRDAVARHEWLQFQCDTQLAAAQDAATAAGMRVGLVADLAVGVDPGGADAWALQDDLALDVTVGAPPDAFTQMGQDWRLPPLRPDRLAASGCAPFRALVATLLRHAGGIRVDHALGLFRLYWIPRGAPPDAGTYVRYPADDLLGVLTAEAEAAGAVVVGEDLGTVEDGVTDALRERGVLGTSVVWFEREDEAEDAGRTASAPAPPRPSGTYPGLALTCVTTHDLPTPAGWLAGEPTRVRTALGLLTGDPADQRAADEAERARLLELLESEGLLAAGDRDDVAAVVVALHAFAARTPSALVTVGLADAAGDLRQPNLPGTTTQYPNWRLPVAVPAPRHATRSDDGLLPASRPVDLDALLDDGLVTRVVAAVRAARPR